jgi:hypothetical protein
MARKVRRKRRNPRSEAGGGDLTAFSRALQISLRNVRFDDLRPDMRSGPPSWTGRLQGLSACRIAA